MVNYLHIWFNKHETSVNSTPITSFISLFIFLNTSDSLLYQEAVKASLTLTHQRMEETRGRNGEDRRAILVSHSHERWNLYIYPLSAPVRSEKRRLSVFAACCIR